MNKEREATYLAEAEAGDSVSGIISAAARIYLTRHNGDDISSVSCQHYIDYVLAQRWFIAAFPNQAEPVTVKGGPRVRSSASRWLREIKVATCHRGTTRHCEWVLLHELAHIVTTDPGRPAPRMAESAAQKHARVTNGHTHAFRVNEVRLVRGMLGDQAAYLLRRSFNKHDVTCHR